MRGLQSRTNRASLRKSRRATRPLGSATTKGCAFNNSYLVRLVPGFAPRVGVPAVDLELLHVCGLQCGRGRRCRGALRRRCGHHARLHRRARQPQRAPRGATRDGEHGGAVARVARLKRRLSSARSGSHTCATTTPCERRERGRAAVKRAVVCVSRRRHLVSRFGRYFFFWVRSTVAPATLFALQRLDVRTRRLRLRVFFLRTRTLEFFRSRCMKNREIFWVVTWEIRRTISRLNACGKPALVSDRRFQKTTGGGEGISENSRAFLRRLWPLKTLLETIKRHGQFARRSLSRTLHLPPTHSSPLLSPTGTLRPRERAREVFRTPRRPRCALGRSGVEIQHPRPAAKRVAGSRMPRARRRDGAFQGGTCCSGRANASSVTLASTRTARRLGTAPRDCERACFRKRGTTMAARRRRRQRESRRRARARRGRRAVAKFGPPPRACASRHPLCGDERARAGAVARDGLRAASRASPRPNRESLG